MWPPGSDVTDGAADDAADGTADGVAAVEAEGEAKGRVEEEEEEEELMRGWAGCPVLSLSEKEQNTASVSV